MDYQPCLSMASSSVLRQGLRPAMRPLVRLEYETLSGAQWYFNLFLVPYDPFIDYPNQMP